ncbi:hypothetical protein OAA27_00785 [bacterium]|nr:hypothetical protein [bacterium]
MTCQKLTATLVRIESNLPSKLATYEPRHQTASKPKLSSTDGAKGCELDVGIDAGDVLFLDD